MCFCLIKVKLQLIMTMIISDMHTINHILDVLLGRPSELCVSVKLNQYGFVLYARLDFRLHNAIWN